MVINDNVWLTTAGSNTTGGYYDSFGVWHPYSYNISWSSPYTIYLYQIFCPKKNCNTANWLKLDTITPCTKCGAKLKAVMESADYEIPVTP